jgi:hypothetical protein
MKRLTLLGVFALNWALGVALAAPPVIGTVTASGAFRLNGDTVMANGTLTEGAVLETGRGNSSVRLTGGARLFLSPDSRGKLFSDRIVLEKGETRLENGAEFHLEVLGLTIRPERGVSTGQIGLLGSNRVRVAALTGSFRVLNARGVLVANIAAGSALALEPQSPAAAALTRITGTLIQQSGHFLLTDQVTRVTVEITGQGLAVYVGQVVAVTGTPNLAAAPAARASQVIAAKRVQTISADATGGRARQGAAAAGIGGSTGARMGIKTTALVGGVAAAAAFGGLAASGTLPGQSRAPLGVPAGPPATPPGQPPDRPPVTPPETPPGQPPDRPPVDPPGPPPLSR